MRKRDRGSWIVLTVFLGASVGMLIGVHLQRPAVTVACGLIAVIALLGVIPLVRREPPSDEPPYTTRLPPTRPRG